MNVLLLNDTRIDPNPGCQVTVRALIAEVSRLVDGPIATRLRGDRYDYFAPLVAARQSHSVIAWEAAVQRLLQDDEVRSILDAADLVVANLEGTLHHHSTGSLALAGMIAAAHRLGKRVWAVNGTVEAIDRWLLDRVLAPAELLSVREPRSYRWLRSQGIACELAADCAFLCRDFDDRADRARTGVAMYTPGVLARLPGPRSAPERTVEDMRAIEARGLRPIYFQVDDAEAPIAERVRACGWEVGTAADTPWSALPGILRQMDLVVSGRYHVLIFAAMAGVPVIAKPSNTWKIEGVMELLQRSGQIADGVADLDALLARGLPLPIEPRVIEECRSRAASTLRASAYAT